MTREQAKANLIALGIAEPTDEAISNYLNQIGGETKRTNDRLERMKADAEKVAELQRQLDEINSANMTEIEKANVATETANKRVVELEKKLVSMENRNQLASMGIVGEQAEALIKEDGGIDFAVLSQIISERETKAASQKEKELLLSTPNPQGNGSDPSDTKAIPADVENAKKLVFASPSVSDTEKDYYLIH